MVLGGEELPGGYELVIRMRLLETLDLLLVFFFFQATSAVDNTPTGTDGIGTIFQDALLQNDEFLELIGTPPQPAKESGQGSQLSFDF